VSDTGSYPEGAAPPDDVDLTDRYWLPTEDGAAGSATGAEWDTAGGWATAAAGNGGKDEGSVDDPEPRPDDGGTSAATGWETAAAQVDRVIAERMAIGAVADRAAADHAVGTADDIHAPGDLRMGSTALTRGRTQVGEPDIAEHGIGGLTSAPQPTLTAGDVLPGMVRPIPLATRRSTRRDPHATRRPALGLPAAILLGLAAAFFGWVSAEPFWLSYGYGTTGTATVISCSHGTLDNRCVGRFTSADGRVTTGTVRISGVPDRQRHARAALPAQVLQSDSDWAYAGSPGNVRMRWQLGFVAALLCGLAIGVVTGVRTLRSAKAGGRLALWLLGLAGPLALFGGMLLTALV
jgi:hypothetical protein